MNALQYLQDLVYKHGVAPDAAKKNALGGYVITQKSAHPEEAWEFVKWTMTENQATLAKQQSWIPVRKADLKNAGKPAWAPQGYEKTRFEWMNYGMIGDIYHEKWREAQDKFVQPIVDQIFLNKISAADGLKQMEEQVNKLINEP